MTPNLIEAMARAIDTAGVIAGATGHRLTAQRVLTAISESGYAVVPREPTEAMAAHVHMPVSALLDPRQLFSSNLRAAIAAGDITQGGATS